MKILFNPAGVAQGTALDSYDGPDAWCLAPEGFAPGLICQYTLVNGKVVFTPPTRISRMALRNRFTQAEKVALEVAALDNPADAAPARHQAAVLRVYLADLAAAEYFDLSCAKARAGVQHLEAVALLAPGRAQEILDAPVEPEERRT